MLLESAIQITACARAAFNVRRAPRRDLPDLLVKQVWAGLDWCSEPRLGCTSCYLQLSFIKGQSFAGPHAVAAEPVRNVVPPRKSSVEARSPCAAVLRRNVDSRKHLRI